jgi:multidrug resistance efflux pump
MEEVEELKVSQAVAGRLATLQVAIGQQVRQGELLAKLDAQDIERRLRTAKKDAERSRARLADCLKDAGGEAGTRDPRLLPFEQDLRTQEARVADLEAEERKLQIVAPASGTVSRIAGHCGEWKSAGGEVLVLLVSHPERRTGYLSERLISSVGIGSPVTLRPRDLAGPPLEGRVIELGPQIEQVPARLRAVPGAPQWGRKVVFEVKPGGASLPGQLYDVRFH